MSLIFIAESAQRVSHNLRHLGEYGFRSSNRELNYHLHVYQIRLRVILILVSFWRKLTAILVY